MPEDRKKDDYAFSGIPITTEVIDADRKGAAEVQLIRRKYYYNNIKYAVLIFYWTKSTLEWVVAPEYSKEFDNLTDANVYYAGLVLFDNL